jgi:hypothetical protein
MNKEILLKELEGLKYALSERMVEQFTDYAEMCSNLSAIANIIMELSKSGEEEFTLDNTTRTNLEVLTEILDASSKLFLTCDPYYR